MNKEVTQFFKKLFSSSQQFSAYLPTQINAQEMNFSAKKLFSKCEHIHIKLRIYSHLLDKSFTENFIFLCREYYWFYYRVFQIFLQT